MPVPRSHHGERQLRAYESPGSTPGLVPVPKAGCGTPAPTSLAFFNSKHFDLYRHLSQAAWL